MMKPKTLELYRALKESDWTAHVGEAEPGARCVTREQALELAASDQCGELWLHERNALAHAICERSYQRYNDGWNKVITDAPRDEIVELVDSKYPPAGPLGEVRLGVKTGVQWLVAHALIESELSDAHDRSFFRDAVGWLIRGHLLCNWAEDLAEGEAGHPLTGGTATDAPGSPVEAEDKICPRL